MGGAVAGGAGAVVACAVAAQSLQYFFEPVVGALFIIRIAFLQSDDPLAADIIKLLIHIFTSLAEQGVGSIAQRQYAEFQFIQPEAAIVNMVIEFPGGGRRFSVALGADDGKEIFFF